jgi:hypothetical protein
MSTTDTESYPSRPDDSHELYRSDLSRVEPVSDAQILAT